MPDSTRKKLLDAARKKLLDAALKALLATADTTAWVKVPATFVSELAARFNDLPDDQRAALTKATPEVRGEAQEPVNSE